MILNEARQKKIDDLRAEAMVLPLLPGVYIMKNSKKDIIYIGKAKALKSRVSQYFGTLNGHTEKVFNMVLQVREFDYIVTDSEFEALVLECSLIKQHKPKYNILLKDDKGYHYIKLSKPPFSRISFERTIEEDGSKYYGPYVSSYTVRQAVDEANKIFQIPTCNKEFGKGKKSRPCLNYHIKQCCAPCRGNISAENYNERLQNAMKFITQDQEKVVNQMKSEMEEAAENLEFERAARIRDRVAAIEKLSHKQKVVMSKTKDQDVIAVATSGGKAAFEVFRFAKGRLHDREDFIVEEGTNLPELRTEFLQSYYNMRSYIPRQITVDGETADIELTELWLSEKAGRKVKVVMPQIGEQAKLAEMCRNNAAERLAKHIGQTGREVASLDEFARLLGLAVPPEYIESYDISHTAGQDMVGGMVVFENGKPLKAAYKRFILKEAKPGDDYGAMSEVLSRRFQRYFDAEEPTGFGRLPDLILLDGGIGQVGAVKPVLAAFNLDVPVYGMVKDDNHRTRAIAATGGEIAINSRRSAFTLVSNIQEEVHRYAVTFHRQRRKKMGIGTVLTEIEGVGEGLAKSLLIHFGSLKAIKNADAETLCEVKRMPKKTAENIISFFKKDE